MTYNAFETKYLENGGYKVNNPPKLMEGIYE